MKLGTFTLVGPRRSFEARQLSSFLDKGSDRGKLLPSSEIFASGQQRRLQILSRQLFMYLPDSQGLLLHRRLNDCALFGEAQLRTCLGPRAAARFNPLEPFAIAIQRHYTNLSARSAVVCVETWAFDAKVHLETPVLLSAAWLQMTYYRRHFGPSLHYCKDP